MTSEGMYPTVLAGVGRTGPPVTGWRGKAERQERETLHWKSDTEAGRERPGQGVERAGDSQIDWGPLCFSLSNSTFQNNDCF